jgi:uncharacterized membrane protein YdjX (TVP38/TMEM64 family)
MSRAARPGGNRTSPWRLLALPVALLVVLVLWQTLHGSERVVQLQAWIRSLGPLAPVVYTLIDALANPLVVPAFAFTVTAAALFGPVVGLVVVVVASNLGAALCFLIARYLARDAVVALVADREEYRRIDRLVTEHGALAVFLVRLVPISPFEIASYAFGLTGIPFSTFVLWTLIGSFPGAVLYVVGASTVFQALETRRFPVVLFAVFLVALAAVILLGRGAARRLRL